MQRQKLTPCALLLTLGARRLFFPFTRKITAKAAPPALGKKNKPLVKPTENLISMQISYHVSYQTEMTYDRA